MLKECAVEPGVFARREHFRYLEEKFGIGEGRFILKYPKHWKLLVWQACESSSASTMERKWIEERLRTLAESKFLKSKRLYQESSGWLENVVVSDKEVEFDVIVTLEPQPISRAVVAESIEECTPVWSLPRDGTVPRKADDLAGVVSSLLRRASTILFVDQHFKLEARFIKPLEEFLKAARIGTVPSKIEYHLSNEKTGAAEWFAQMLEVKRSFLRLQPHEEIVFVRWDSQGNAENMHARYVLTNRGGIGFDYGLDEGAGTTAWVRLSEPLWEQRMQEYQPDSTPFRFVDAWKVTSTTVVAVGWTGTSWQPAT
jgi:hypothetical protein